MDRRELLKLIGALSVGAYATPVLGNEASRVHDFGARKPVSGSRGPRFYDRFGAFRGIATKGKNTFLWKELEKEIGEIEPHWQGPAKEKIDGYNLGAPGEGDCVGHSGAMGCDVLAAVNKNLLGKREKFVAKTSVEMSYAGSRVEIGGGDIRGRGGSRGEWMAQFYKEFGVLHRLKYERGGNSLDLSGYHPGRSRTYRDQGVPDWLEPVSREHPVKEFTNVRTGKEALDAVCAGQPVIMCSSYAFKSQRDSEGFCEAHEGREYKRGWKWISVREQWWHAMILTGALLEGGRIGGLIQNSHGDWNDGPRPHGIPRGSFFVDLRILDLMVKDWFDCWALSGYLGHESKRMKHRLY